MGWRAGDSNEQCLNVYVKSLVFILVLFKLLVFFEKTLFNRKTVFILNVNQHPTLFKAYVNGAQSL